MHTIEFRPWRLILLFSTVFMLAAYLPHPQLGEPLPKALTSLVRTLLNNHSTKS